MFDLSPVHETFCELVDVIRHLFAENAELRRERDAALLTARQADAVAQRALRRERAARGRRREVGA